MRKLFLLLSTVILIFFAFNRSGTLHVAENDNVEDFSIEVHDTNIPDDVDNSDETIDKTPVDEETPAPWWENNFLTVTGYGLAPEPENGEEISAVTRRTKALSKRAAMTDAYRKLAEQIGEIRITAEKNFVKQQVEAVVKFAEVTSEEYDEYGDCVITMRIPIYGVKDSVARAAFKRVDKEKFPPPTDPVSVTGDYTGLIIDCGDTEINPVLSPEIRTENQSIYRYANLNYDKVVKHGMIAYEQKFSADGKVILTSTSGKISFAQVGSKIFLADKVETNSRVGNNPLVVKASEMSNDGSCPVISDGDADKILAENEVSHFLDDGAVVFTSSRIRGMRL